MCYASFVMLRGRRSCAISDRLTPSSFALSSLFRPLTPLFPLHPRNSPVTPLFPLLTHKQGGGVYLCSLSVLPSSPLCVYPDRVGVSSVVRRSCSAFSFSPLVHPACPELRGERSPRRATPHLPLTPIIPAPLATAALRVVPAPIFTTTSSIHVGAPTILFRERTTASQQFPDRRAMLSSNCALLTLDCELLFSPNSNHSRTYARVARKSNYSRTYAKHRGWGYPLQNAPANNSFVFSRHVNDMCNYISNYIVGAPTFLNAERSDREERQERTASEGGPYTSTF